MLRAITVAAAFAVPVLAQSPTGVVINEVMFDDAGSDDFEFVEVYNSSSVTVDLSGWTLEGFEGDPGAANGTYTFPPGTMLAAGDFWVVGSPGVPNVDDALGALRLENGCDGVALLDASLVPQDGVILELWELTTTLPTWAEGGLYAAIQGTELAGNLLVAIGRSYDGVDTDDNACDFRPMPATPGELNLLGTAVFLPYQNNFDGTVGDDVSNDFLYSFTPGNVQDPAAVQVAIIAGIPQPPVAFPASPQGGNIGVWHDPSGGGNANWLKNVAVADYELETYVYLTGPNAAFDVDDGEQWVVGVRGHSDSFGEFWDVNGFLTTISCGTGQAEPGHTGIGWLHHRTDTVSDLYLMDFGSGGSFTVLAGPINIQTGVNDGWQRIRLATVGTNVFANFGGTYGVDDGAQFVATTSTVCANGVYLTYRECVTDNNNLLPLMTDGLQVLDLGGGPAASFATAGSGCPSPSGISNLSCPQLPVIGTPLEVAMDNVSPTGLALMIIGFNPAGPFPISVLGLTPDPTCLALVSLDALVGPLGVSGGVASVTLPLPNNPALAGTPLYFQGTQLELTTSNWSLTEQGLATVGF